MKNISAKKDLMWITLNIIDGHRKTVWLKGTELIGDLKKHLAKKSQTKKDFIYKGIILSDLMTFNSYGIKCKDCILVVENKKTNIQVDKKVLAMNELCRLKDIQLNRRENVRKRYIRACYRIRKDISCEMDDKEDKMTNFNIYKANEPSTEALPICWNDI